VFDCSGFVVACWKRGGVNLISHGLGDSRSVVNDHSFLQTVQRHELMPGDLIAWPGHIGMVYSDSQVIESTPNGGVKLSSLDKFASHAGAVYKRVPG
jgi:cell wall-associated NlpC family hydrolase